MRRDRLDECPSRRQGVSVRDDNNGDAAPQGIRNEEMTAQVLLIEKTDVLRRALRDWIGLRFPGTSVFETERLPDAFGVLSIHAPQAIVADLDAATPRKLQTLSSLRAAAPGAELIVIGMDDFPCMHRSTRRAGASGYVCKARIDEELPPLLARALRPQHTPRPKQLKTVLCIDDELELIRLIELTLSRGPFRVVGAIGGRDGLELARQARPDVILLDLMMPDFDGFQVHSQVRADEELKEVPIVVLSVLSPSNPRARTLDVDDFITKPFTPGDLMERVEAAASLAG